MLRKLFVTSVAIVAVSLVDANVARAGTIAISNTDSGWYDSTGAHGAGNPNYISGDLTGLHYRNFFTFDLTAAAGETIASAQLQLYTYTITGAGTYTTYDVLTPVSTLTAGGTGQTATYIDLGSGVSFGSISLNTPQSHSLILIDLNAAAIAAIQAQANGGDVFAIGGDFLGGGTYAYGCGRACASTPGATNVNQLILQTGSTHAVPDSGSTLVLMLLVIVLFGVCATFLSTPTTQLAGETQ